MLHPAPPVVECYLLDTGHCLASEHHIIRGGTRHTVACRALVALLRHPERGWLLWDTGYAGHMLEATRPWPFLLYRRATPLRFTPEQAAAHQLARFGLRPDDIRHVIISHFHADHVAGLRDFPAAQFVALRAAYADVAHRRGWAALRRAFIPALLPTNFLERAQLLDAFHGPPLPALGPTHDLFGDGSLRLVELPGHARGQIGMLANTTRGPVLLAADGAWQNRAIRELRPPHLVASLIVDDARAVVETLNRLHAFSLARPDVALVPTHCPEWIAD